MNCLEFRRQLATDPTTREPRFQAHEAGCGRCAAAAADARAFEGRLIAALAVPVPEGLADRILLRQTTDLRNADAAPRRAAPPGWLKIAAAVVLAVGGVGGATWFHFASADLAELSVSHLPHEPMALSSRARIRPEEVNAMFASVDAPLVGTPGEINYLHRCRVGKDMTVHMVVQATDGPVTLLYFVDRKAAERRSFERNGVVGRQVPMGAGTLMLMASQDHNFDALEHTWRGAIVGATHEAAGAP